MKQLTCEMCGSTELVKDGGYFICQTCGTKYSVEEAKKMMIEGTVEVQGTVKVDRSDNIEKFYQLARRAREDGDSETATKYYEMILLENPNSWEAAFYRLLFSTKNCTLAQMENKLYNFANSIESIFQLINNQDNKNEIYEEVYVEALSLYNMFFTNYINRAKGYSDPTRARENLTSGTDSLAYMAILLGDCYYTYANDKEKALCCYDSLAVHREGKHRATAIERVKKINPNYEPPAMQTGGCYVATCVYGSYDCPQVWTLRRYRDNTLGSTWYGRAFIRTYYAISPTLVKWFGDTKWFKKMWKGKLDRMVKKLQDNGVENTPYKDKEW
ncbi:MAG: hypothetical protein E7348_01990 [Clostridiales bacterium]|nr:hypothetical protein [Clostridiales bacterium]